jgi:hypothetical protein
MPDVLAHSAIRMFGIAGAERRDQITMKMRRKRGPACGNIIQPVKDQDMILLDRPV